MALEPTDEQERALASLLLACGSTRGCEASDAGRVWAFVRDHVLEQAAKACEGIEPYVYEGDGTAMVDAVRGRIRAMKGTP